MKKDRSKMTAREWNQTPEGMKAMRKRAEPMIKSFQRESQGIMIAPPLAIRSNVFSTPKFLDYQDGNFYTRGKLIDFRDLTSNYALVVKALLLEADSSGFLSYDDINKHLERAGKRRIASEEGQRDRISNALVTLRRKRRRQKHSFPTELPDGSPVIRTVSGKGLIVFR